MTTTPTSLGLKNLERIVDEDGGISVAVIESFGCIAAAAQKTHSLALLRRRSGESLTDLLQRLDAAVATAYATGSRVDEVNVPPNQMPPRSKKSRR